MKFKQALIFLSLFLMLPACNQTLPKEALELSKDSFSLRQLQTRSFETSNEKK